MGDLVSEPSVFVDRMGLLNPAREFLTHYRSPWLLSKIGLVSVPALFDQAFRQKWEGEHEPRLNVLRSKALQGGPKSSPDPALLRGDELALFRAHHENDYSNWLAWLFSETNPACEILQQTLFRQAFRLLPGIGVFRVCRERRVEEGFENQTGRLDLQFARTKSKTIVVIENKTVDPNPAELEKHKGYAKSIRENYSGWNHHLVLLVPRKAALPRDAEMHGFEICEWKDLSMALRRMVAHGRLQAYADIEVLVRLFVGAIEGHLLAYPVTAWRQFLTGDLPDQVGARAIVRSGYVDYLEDAYAHTEEQ